MVQQFPIYVYNIVPIVKIPDQSVESFIEPHGPVGFFGGAEIEPTSQSAPSTRHAAVSIEIGTDALDMRTVRNSGPMQKISKLQG